MALLVFLIIAGLAVWWFASERRISVNERQYLRRRGYEIDPPLTPGAPVNKDVRLLSLIESLEDLSPYSRQKAAEDLARMCAANQKDARMFLPLIRALHDSDAAVRKAAAGALAELGDARAIAPLKERRELEDSVNVEVALDRVIERLETKSRAEGPQPD